MSDNEWVEVLDRDGWAVTEPLVPELEIAALGAALARLSRGDERRGGVRNLLEISPEVRALAASPAVRGVAEAVLGTGAFAVRALLFDKTPAANWKVAWHQDRTVAVRERREVPGFGPWTVKAGVPHAQAPVSVLERMLAVRVHLDPCGPTTVRSASCPVPIAAASWRRRRSKSGVAASPPATAWHHAAPCSHFAPSSCMHRPRPSIPATGESSIWSSRRRSCRRLSSGIAGSRQRDSARGPRGTCRRVPSS